MLASEGCAGKAMHCAAVESHRELKKIFKGNCLAFAHFWSKSDSFFDWCITKYFPRKIYFQQIRLEIWHFC